MLHPDLKEFVALLISHQVDFLVVGAHAVAFHGRPRYTGDLDILLRPSEVNALQIMDVLRAFGFGAFAISASDFTTPERVVQLGKEPNRIDLVTSITGVTFEEAWAGRVSGELAGLKVWFPSKADLIRNKRATGREKDLIDLGFLQKVNDNP